MPEIKNNFLKGRMNKDLDERLIPNGEYRHAKNIEVSTSETSSVGVVKNILGNHRLEDIVDTTVFKCVGSIANDKTDKLYWFISSYYKDAILEYDTVNDISSWVLVDTNAGNYKSVLKFYGNIITGINIIDNLLFWTDNNSEPKKINIDTCKTGTDQSGNFHTQLIFENGSFDGTTVLTVGTSSISDYKTGAGKYFWFDARKFLKTINTWEHHSGDSSNTTVMRAAIRHYRDEKFLGAYDINFFNTVNSPNPNPNDVYVENATNTGFIPHESGGYPSGGTVGRRIWADSLDTDWEVGDVIFGDDVRVDIEERHITVIKPKPLSAFSVKINHSDNNSISTIPNLFETKFPRFSYRYKYRDGEYSTFAPFTAPVFNPKYPKDSSVSIDTNVFYNKDNAYDIKEPYNKAMINSIHSVDLSGFITAETPEDVVEIDILYKQENSNVIYSIDTIQHINKEWHLASNHEGVNIGDDKAIGYDTYAATGGLTSGKYVVTTENIYAALPANQLLRSWDNVPKKALAQEITGNRIVYGNYIQNYDLSNNTRISVSYGDRKSNINDFTTQGLPSIKSQRNYQLGIVYCDKYGRETPVFTSKGGAVSVPWQDSNGNKNASRNLQLNASVLADFPSWVDSFKFFVKETSNEYYNLTMDRAWVTSSTYELDNSEGHIWISFPSSDRNKISEEDYIILKKKIGVGEEQVSFENKFKIIDIKNEAPDAIKYDLVNQGTVVNTGGTNLTTIIGANYLNQRIDTETNTIRITREEWEDALNIPLQEGVGAGEGDTFKFDDLYLSWRRVDGSEITSSKKYKINGGFMGSANYIIKLNTTITRIDADIAHINGDSSTGNAGLDLHPDLTVQIQKKQLIDSEDFSGKFFVKISKNQITDIVQSGNTIDILDKYQVTSKTSSWLWQDDIDNGIIVNAGDYGITNHNGSVSPMGSGTNNIHNVANNTTGTTTITAGNGTSTLKITDWWLPWKGIKDVFGSTFFLDSMHMVAGQSEASDYAKYCCITWSGCTAGNENSAEDSSWSYPPLKTWITDFEHKASALEEIENDSVWYNDNLISTSPLIPENENWNGEKIDGWVGPLQKVDRDGGVAGSGQPAANHINGLEGLVTTVDDHAIGPRRWFSGITAGGSERGVGVDTKTYSSDKEIGKHFMHLSFFAPGKDLHDNNWNLNTSEALHGANSWSDNLQGIWGGGVFTGDKPDAKYGVNNDYYHLAMEGNYDSSNNVLPETPAPGIGYGYNTNYRELHERQWDPTFNSDEDGDNRIRDFIRNLYPGSKFRFNKVTSDQVNPIIDNTVYTIKNVITKKLYNHTSWRKNYNRYHSTNGYTGIESDEEYQSVEDVGLAWLDQVKNDGSSTDTMDNAAGEAYGNDTVEDFKKKIVDFGKAHNRRICYIIELDKNPADSTSALGNPVNSSQALNSGGVNDPDAVMNASIDANGFCDIEFLDPVVAPLLSDLSKFPAIWEVDPKKKEVDLDIYYEASSSIPVEINEETNELFAPIGCKVEILNSSVTGSSTLEYWDGRKAYFTPGFAKGDGGGNEIDYSGMSFKFIRQDGSYTVAEADLQSLDGITNGNKTSFAFKKDIGSTITNGLSWYNCFSFGNGLESNRIKDDFNEMFIINGVKASSTIQETYKEEHRPHGLIYSGIYNSNSGINDLNQFIMAEKITKDLNPTYGSIQKLFQRRISLITFCEDRVISITSNKDAIYNADGNPQLIASDKVLGDANPFVGSYGISKNPESFASESYRAYFTDKQRGTVLRLSKDGLTPISQIGFKDWFRDNLSQYNTLMGTYDNYKEDYNLTLTNDPSFSENIIMDAYLETGIALTPDVLGTANNITNPEVYHGTNLQYLYNNPTYDVLEYDNSANVFDWSPFTISEYNLTTNVTITHHAKIDTGDLQAYVSPLPATSQSGTNFSFAGYGMANAGLADDGWFYDPNFEPLSGAPNDIFGPDQHNNRETNGYNNWDGQAYSYVYRHIAGEEVDEGNVSSHPVMNTAINANTYGSTQYNPTTQKAITFPCGWWHPYEMNKYSMCITRTNNHAVNDGVAGSIVFDRCNPSDSYVEFRNIGRTGYGLDGHLMDDYAVDAGGNAGDIRHRTFYNGDELHVQIELECYPTNDNHTNSASYHRRGYNYIMPEIQLFDGATPLNLERLQPVHANSHAQTNQPNYNPYLYCQQVMHNPGSYISGQPQVPGFTTSSSWGGSNPGYSADANDIYYNKRWISTGFSQSPIVQFPGTDTIDDLTTSVSYGGSAPSKTVLCNISFKFRDDGTYSLLQNNNETGDPNAIVEAKVVDDLRIRVSNNYAASSAYSTTTYTSGTTGSWNNSNGDYPLNNQLWEIRGLKTKKGFGVVSEHTPFEPVVNVGADRAEVQEVPSVDIPPWTEVVYASNYGFGTGSWQIDLDAYGGSTTNHFSTHANSATEYGDEYTAVAQTGLAANTTTQSNPPTDVIHYVVPNGFNMTTGVENPPSTVGDNIVAGASFDRTAYTNYPNDLSVSYSAYKIPVAHDNDYIEIIADQSTDATDIYFDISSDPWSVGDTWYLVDVEFDNAYGAGSNFGIGGNYGSLHVRGATSLSGYSSGVEVDSDGVGVYSGSGSSAPNPQPHLRLVQTSRVEYGNPPETVLRGIFKVASDSWMNNDPVRLDKFTLRVYGCTSGGRIKKIITKKLSNDDNGIWSNWLASNGTAQYWTDLQGEANVDEVVHAFDNKHVYLQNSRLCWDTPTSSVVDISLQKTYSWEQQFGTANTESAPEYNTPSSWEFTFTVDNNSSNVNDPLLGKLRGFVSTTKDASTNMSEGLYFKNIDHAGNYLIKFTFNGDNTNWSMDRADLGSTTFTDYTGTGNIQAISTVTSWDGLSHIMDRIHFSTGSNSPSRFAVSKIKLTDTTPVFLGGTAGSWNFEGFDTSLYDWVYWDVINERLNFEDCPPFSTDENKFININQQIDTTINKYDKYKISFSHYITTATATLSIYYYNSNGQGFKLNDPLNSNFNTLNYDVNSASYYQYENTVTIGDSSWSSVNQLNSEFNSDIKNSFVIEVNGSDDESISGWIDNIEMLRVFDIADVENTTITFNENTKGWTSFKDFVLENGTSVSKKYFTFNNGGLYQHYVPLKKDANNDWITGEVNATTGSFVKYTAEEAENYNVFYSVPYESSVKAVLNKEPSVVKTFNTINYEGSQTRVIKPNNVNEITLDNAIAWGTIDGTNGWECSEIKTDLDNGSIIEFIKKEGKWFNYIKGKSTTNTLDTSLFSVQGVGLIQSVESTSGYFSQSSSSSSSNSSSGTGSGAGSGTGSGTGSGGGTGAGAGGGSGAGGGGGTGGGGY